MAAILRNIALALLVTGLAACSGMVDPGDGHDVPEGTLRIFADKTAITADGNDIVTFNVMFGSENVSNAKTCQIFWEFEGNKKPMQYGVNEFSTVTAGQYRFTAEYYHAGMHFSDNAVEVEALPYFSGEVKSYEQRLLGVYFTSTGCTSCPMASRRIKELQAANPGKISVIAFHADMEIPDPMTIEETYTFKNSLGGFTGMPAFFWNLNEDAYDQGPEYSDTYCQMKDSYEPQCGVSIKTVEKGSSEYEVILGVTSNIPARCRYHIFVVEDGIVADQSGETDYIHDNVVRDVLTLDVAGDRLNSDLPMTVGVEATASRKFTVHPSWKHENIRIVAAAAMLQNDRFVVNNVAECRLGDSVSYQYAD